MCILSIPYKLNRMIPITKYKNAYNFFILTLLKTQYINVLDDTLNYNEDFDIRNVVTGYEFRKVVGTIKTQKDCTKYIREELTNQVQDLKLILNKNIISVYKSISYNKNTHELEYEFTEDFHLLLLNIYKSAGKTKGIVNGCWLQSNELEKFFKLDTVSVKQLYLICKSINNKPIYINKEYLYDFLYIKERNDCRVLNYLQKLKDASFLLHKTIKIEFSDNDSVEINVYDVHNDNEYDSKTLSIEIYGMKIREYNKYSKYDNEVSEVKDYIEVF